MHVAHMNESEVAGSHFPPRAKVSQQPTSGSKDLTSDVSSVYSVCLCERVPCWAGIDSMKAKSKVHD